MQKDVGDIRTDDVANGDAGRTGHGGLNAGDEFGGRGAEADEREANEKWRHAEPFGDGDGAAHEQFAADDEQDEPAE